MDLFDRVLKFIIVCKF